MKKIFLAIFTTLFLMPFMVSADEITPYYTNLNGAELTEQQYNNLIKVFSEDTIATMTVEQINLVKDNENLVKTEDTKYVRVDDIYDLRGNIVSRIEKEVTEEEAQNFLKEKKNSPQTRASASYSTSMKRITLTVVPSGYVTHRVITLTNTWLSIPSVKSYDVLAVGAEATSYYVRMSGGTLSGYQKYDGAYHRYTQSSDNTKISTGWGAGGGGIGISMNIDDSVTSSLENSLTVTLITDAEPFVVHGTYQHATSNVSLSQSKNYTFSENGMGGVLNFASSVSSYYDGMRGVEVASYGNILN
ncbi:MAG: hypothetical protein E7174_02030 [Firmicutes bacterium]|nr:hypothetical protein [Bacillota bacterium]